MKKYTKKELLGSIFKIVYTYIVVEKGKNDVQLQKLGGNELFPEYNLARLNSIIQYLDLSTLNKSKQIIQIY